MEIMNTISTELLLLIGIAISGGIFLWKIQHTLTADISVFRKKIKEGFSGLRVEIRDDIKEVKNDISGLRNEVNSLGQRIAKIEGLLMPTPNVTRPQSTE